jgi:hypothetical protein
METVVGAQSWRLALNEIHSQQINIAKKGAVT